ncbi:hypothetical protein [Absidia glauca]|uniref:Uncharacterized protein n=1 Tax=Absidia glauca TaxID=4829 RepID=A0A168LKM5_ABSGL|nr:hypothetical protein [Absidia glauca]
MSYLLEPYSAPLPGSVQNWGPAAGFKGSMSGPGAFPGEIYQFEDWIDMWALERMLGMVDESPTLGPVVADLELGVMLREAYSTGLFHLEHLSIDIHFTLSPYGI